MVEIDSHTAATERSDMTELTAAFQTLDQVVQIIVAGGLLIVFVFLGAKVLDR